MNPRLGLLLILFVFVAGTGAGYVSLMARPSADTNAVVSGKSVFDSPYHAYMFKNQVSPCQMPSLPADSVLGLTPAAAATSSTKITDAEWQTIQTTPFGSGVEPWQLNPGPNPASNQFASVTVGPSRAFVGDTVSAQTAIHTPHGAPRPPETDEWWSSGVENDQVVTATSLSAPMVVQLEETTAVGPLSFSLPEQYSTDPKQSRNRLDITDIRGTPAVSWSGRVVQRSLGQQYIGFYTSHNDYRTERIHQGTPGGISFVGGIDDKTVITSRIDPKVIDHEKVRRFVGGAGIKPLSLLTTVKTPEYLIDDPLPVYHWDKFQQLKRTDVQQLAQTADKLPGKITSWSLDKHYAQSPHQLLEINNYTLGTCNQADQIVTPIDYLSHSIAQETVNDTADAKPTDPVIVKLTAKVTDQFNQPALGVKVIWRPKPGYTQTVKTSEANSRPARLLGIESAHAANSGSGGGTTPSSPQPTIIQTVDTTTRFGLTPQPTQSLCTDMGSYQACMKSLVEFASETNGVGEAVAYIRWTPRAAGAQGGDPTVTAVYRASDDEATDTIALKVTLPKPTLTCTQTIPNYDSEPLDESSLEDENQKPPTITNEYTAGVDKKIPHPFHGTLDCTVKQRNPTNQSVTMTLKISLSNDLYVPDQRDSSRSADGSVSWQVTIPASSEVTKNLTGMKWIISNDVVEPTASPGGDPPAA